MHRMHRTHCMVFLCNRLPISHGQLLQIGDKISSKIRDGLHRISADLGADIHRGLLDTGANGVHHFLPGQLDLPIFQEVTNDAGHDHKDAFGIIVETQASPHPSPLELTGIYTIFMGAD